MKQYKIFKHPSGSSEAVKQGWSWPAFFFSSIWAMVKKQWTLGVGTLVGLMLFGFIVGTSGSSDALINIVSLIMNIIFGINGNSWRGKNLISRGYEQVDTVTASNSEGAVALYLKAASAER